MKCNTSRTLFCKYIVQVEWYEVEGIGGEDIIIDGQLIFVQIGFVTLQIHIFIIIMCNLLLN